MNKINLVGIGPGHLDYVTPIALQAIETSDLLIGGRRNLQTFEFLKKETLLYAGNLQEIAVLIQKERAKKKISVVVSGDPGFYSLLDYMLRHFSRDDLEVIPGISSFQYLFSKLKRPWKDVPLMSVHGRKNDYQQVLAQKGAVFLLTDQVNNPAKIAREISRQEIKNIRVIVGEELSYPEERITEGDPEKIGEMKFKSLAVMVVIKDEMAL